MHKKLVWNINILCNSYEKYISFNKPIGNCINCCKYLLRWAIITGGENDSWNKQLEAHTKLFAEFISMLGYYKAKNMEFWDLKDLSDNKN